MEEGDVLLQSFPEKYESYADFSDGLLKEVLRNNVEHLLQYASEEHFKKIYDDFNQQNIIAIACTQPNVSEDTLQQLLRYVFEKYPQIDLTNERWYYWEPIHYAAFFVSPEKLRIVLNSRCRDRLNALTVFSENALHVLLEYGRKSEAFNVDFSNGWEKKTYRIISQEHDNLVQCAKLLIEAGININHQNIWNETPIIIALRYRFQQVWNMLKIKPYLDIDFCRDTSLDKSAREIMHDYGIKTNNIPATSVLNKTKIILFSLLKLKDEERFIRFGSGHIKKYSNGFDGDVQNTTSGNMLQLCLVKGFIDYKKKKDYPSENKNISRTVMLRIFKAQGMAKSIEFILDNGALTKQRNRMFHGLNAFQLAVKLHYYPYLVMLLQHKSNQIQQHDILEVLTHAGGTLYDPNNYYSKHVLFLLLSKLEMFYESKSLDYSYHNCTIMSNVVQNCLKSDDNDVYNENILQALRLGAQLGNNKEDESPVNNLSFDIMNIHFDQCLHENNVVCYNSIIVDNEEEYSEIQTLRSLYHHEKNSELLTHPVLINLIHAKWEKSKLFFYLNICLNCIFLVVLYVYMVFLQTNNLCKFLVYIFCSCVSLMCLKELTEVYIYWLRYFYDFMNYLDMCVLGCCIFNIFSKDERLIVVAILLYSTKTLLMLGQIPKFTKFMIIFSSTKYFFQYVLFYFILFFAFAFCFYILLPEEAQSHFNPLEQILVKLFETLFFFIGQYDGEIASPTQFPAFARIIVTLFLFCMTIILNNLLVGLIVTDMDVLQKRAKLLRQLKMAKYVVRIDNFIKTFKWSLKYLNLNTHLFKKGATKELKLLCYILDEEDVNYLKEIQTKKKPDSHTLISLYNNILDEVKITPKRKIETADILEKIIKLEEYLHKLKI